MTDDPSPRELERSIDRVERRIDALASDTVGRREYEQRLKAAEDDIAEIRQAFREIRQACKEEIAEIRQGFKDSQKQRGMDWRQFAYAALVPALLYAASVLSASRGAG